MHSIDRERKSEGSFRRVRTDGLVLGLVDNLDTNVHDAGVKHFEPVGGTTRHIDDATGNKGPAIVDAHDH